MQYNKPDHLNWLDLGRANMNWNPGSNVNLGHLYPPEENTGDLRKSGLLFVQDHHGDSPPRNLQESSSYS